MKLNFDIIEFEEFLVKRQLQPDSIYQYTQVLQRFLITDPDIYNINDYNTFIIDECVKKRKSHVYSVIRMYIKFKIEDLATRNKLYENLVQPKPRHDIVREREYLSEDKIFMVINSLEKLKHKVIALIMHLTGVRVGGIMKLTDGKIFFEEDDDKQIMRIAVTDKGGKRNVPFIYDKTAQDIIMNYLLQNPAETGYYFLELGTFGNRTGSVDDMTKLYKMNYHWYWEDIKRIANGDKPLQVCDDCSVRAMDNFFVVYSRKVNLENVYDQVAINMMAYGIRPLYRDINKELDAIHIFESIYKYRPVSTIEWDIIRAISYSGAIK
jgi:integrase